MKRALLWIAVAVCALLTGCAGLRRVDSDVTAFSTMRSMPATPTYRFERLPSQQLGGEPQAALEAVAAAALAQAGLRRDDASAAYSVLVGLRVERTDADPWNDLYGPRFGFMRGPEYVVNANGQVIFLPSFPYTPSMPWFDREVSLILRDLSTGQVVYETRARNAGRWSDTRALLPAMFEAALRGFPTPPPGVRRVEVQLPPG